jgi:tRNA-dihydrouridine synthase
MIQKIQLAPIQGITDYPFRNAFQKHFGSTDFMYSPYLRLDKDMQLKKSRLKDVLPENNTGVNLIPQIMTNSSEGFIFLSNFLVDNGYSQVNWNLGCPFSMVTSRKLGSGILPFHNEIDQILNEALPKTSLKVSIKMRIGLEDENEIFNVLPILDKYPISEIIIHPRTGKQMYKGEINLQVFEKCLQLTKHSICYNGDINTLSDFESLKQKFKSVNTWMIGRGAVTNPFLVSQIKGEKLPENRIDQFSKFHDELFLHYQNKLSGQSHILNKMRIFWEYFALSFSNSHKVYKKIKKSTSIDKYLQAIDQIYRDEKWVA